MNENFDLSKFVRNEEVGDEKEKQENARSSEESRSESTGAKPESQPGGADGGPSKPPSYDFSADAHAVMTKANEIAIALNHAERTMAHVIAGIALRADAAERFNKCRVSSGAIQFGSSAVSLDSGRALQACLRYIEENVKSRSEERRVDLPLSQDVRDVLGRAQQIANEREQRQIEVGDILQAITEPELYSRMRHLLLGSSSPSLSDIAQDLRQIAFGIAEVRNSAVGPAFVDALTQMQAALQSHMTKFDDVVSATEPSRPFPAVHTSMFNEVRGVPDHGTIKLRNLSSALDEIRGGSQKQEEELDQIDGRIKALEGLCLKLMAIAGVSALAAVLLLGVVGYKSLT